MSTRHMLLIYVLISLVKFLFSLSVPYPIYLTDERQYLEMGRSFLTKGEFLFDGKIWNHYPPLYPITIAAATLLKIDTAFVVIKLINAFLSSTIIFPVYLLSREFLNKKESSMISILSLFVPENFVYSYNILSENLYYPLFMFSVYFLYKSLKDKKFQIFAGIFIGLSILTKSIGFTLLAGVGLTLLIRSLVAKKSFNDVLRQYKDYWLLLTIVLIIILPWYLRNAYYFGPNLYGIIGYGDFSGQTTRHITPLNYPYYVAINLGFLAIGSGLIFFIFSLYAIKIGGDQDFKILFWSILAILILLSAFWSFTDTGEGRKIMGRYTAPLIFLMLIMGGIGIKSFEKKKDDKILLCAAITCSLILVSVPIDIRMGSFDSLSTIFLLVPKQANALGYLAFKIPDLLIMALLVVSPLIIFGFRRHLTLDNVFRLMLVFLIINTFTATATVRYGSLDAEEFMQMAIWMKDNLSRGKMLFDVKEAKDHEQLFWMIEAVKFWTDFPVSEGDYNDAIGYKYVISTRRLLLTPIKELNVEEGVYERKVLKLFLYES